MVRHTSSASAVVGAGLGLGLWLVEITKPVLPEWAIGSLATLAGIMVVYGVWMGAWSLLKQTKPSAAAGGTTSELIAPLRPTARELTNQEKNLIGVIDDDVLQNHFHYDLPKLIEDCLNQLPLSTGLCHCGIPRSEARLRE